jgi:hypothetical protein
MPADPLERWLLGILFSSAMEKYSEGRSADLTFADAAHFWSLTERSRPADVEQRLACVIDNLVELGQQVQARGPFKLAGCAVDGAVLAKTATLHRHLKERFSRHLRLLERHNRPDS